MTPSKSLLGRCLAGALLFSATLALADSTPAPAGSKGGPAAPAAAASNGLATARGVVKSVSGSRLALDTGQPGGGGALTVQLDDGTVVTKQGKSATVKDLHAGDPVTVSYATRDGKAVARRVWIRAR